MARIRSLKPELPSSRKLAAAPIEARYTFILLISQADDEGFVRAEPRQLLGALYPHDEAVTPDDLEAWILALTRVNSIRLRWTGDGARVIQVLGWTEHQSIKQAGKPKISPTLLPFSADSSEKIRRVIPEFPTSDPQKLYAEVVVVGGTSSDIRIFGGSEDGAADAAAELVEDALMRKKARIETKTEEQPAFVAAWERYPTRAGGNSRKLAHRAFAARVAEGVPLADLIAAVDRYAAFVRATGREGTEYVKQAATFFGPGEHWREGWDVPRLPADRSPGAANGESAAMALMRRQDLQRAEWQAELATWTAAETARRLAPGPHEEVRPC